MANTFTVVQSGELPICELHWWWTWILEYVRGGGDSLMSGIRVCATDQGQFFHLQKSRTGPDIWSFTPEEVMIFLKRFTTEHDHFFDNLVSNVKNANVLTYVFLSEFNMIWSSQMNKEYKVKSEQFISLSVLPFHKKCNW